MSKLTTISQILEAASKLTVDSQLELNRSLCDLIKRGRRNQQAQASILFTPGMVVRFDAKSRGIKHIKIEKFNRAGTAVVGYECNPDGTSKAAQGPRWTVSSTCCSKVAVK